MRIFKRVSILVLMIIGIIFVGNISIKNHIFGRTVAEAINVVDTLEIMKESNPINMALNNEIKIAEEENAKIVVANMIKEIEAKKAMEERAKEVERLIKDKDKPSTKADKVAYLTFDDGPSVVVTPQILEILDEYGIKATFFVIGRMAEKYPEILKETFEAGHSIGNHSYSHNYGYIYKNTKNFMEDINKANQALKDVLGDDFSTDLLRFPGGSFGKKDSFLKVVKDEGYDYFDWNALNGDAEGNNLDKKRLVKRLKDTSKNKKNLIILMHDTDAKTSTAESLREILDYLIDEGYRFDVLSNYYN